jgi:hypothetical protein
MSLEVRVNLINHMKGKKKKVDKKGTTVPLTFVIFAVAIFVFFVSLQLYHAAFVDFPSDVAIHQQFNDLGNALSTKTTGAILTVPHKGTVEFEETLPQKIGGHNYRLDLNASLEELQLYSFKGYSYNYTLSGTSAEVNVTVNTTTAYGGTSKAKIKLERLI